MKKTVLLITISLIIFVFEVKAQTEETKTETSEFTLSGEIRPRTEIDHGLKLPFLDGQEAKTYTSQRSRLNFDYKTDKIKMGVSLQDVRTWGEQAQLVANEANAASIHEAWGEFLFTSQLSLKVGRMEVGYDDQRILSNVVWAQQGRSHDLALLKYEGKVKAHLGLTYYGKNYTGANAYKAMQFLWLNGGNPQNFSWSVLALNNGVEEKRIDNNAVTTSHTVYKTTIGARPVFKTGALLVAANIYYQMGKETDGTWTEGDADNKEIAAYNLALDVSYKVSENLQLAAGYEMLSGNDFTDANADKQNAFTPFFGTAHKFNGHMDYFYSNNHFNNIGLNDIYLTLAYTKNKFVCRLMPHFFSAAGNAEYLDTEGATQEVGTLGTEIDVWATYNFAKNASIDFGYSQMFATDAMYALKGLNLSAERVTNNWAWIMFTFKPKFLTVKN